MNVLMCVSGITSRTGEQCLVSSSSAGVHLEPCFEAIAAGDGREIMQFDSVHVRQCHMGCMCVVWQDGQIVSVSDGTCLTLADGDT